MSWMSTLAPWQWALLSLVPLGIILLYFLKLRREPVEVPSTYLWMRTIEDLHVNSLLTATSTQPLAFSAIIGGRFGSTCPTSSRHTWGICGARTFCLLT